MKKKYLTVQELMALWEVREAKTIYSWVKAKKIPFFRCTPRSKLLFPINEIEAFEQARTVVPKILSEIQ